MWRARAPPRGWLTPSGTPLARTSQATPSCRRVQAPYLDHPVWTASRVLLHAASHDSRVVPPRATPRMPNGCSPACSPPPRLHAVRRLFAPPPLLTPCFLWAVPQSAEQARQPTPAAQRLHTLPLNVQDALRAFLWPLNLLTARRPQQSARARSCCTCDASAGMQPDSGCAPPC